MKILVVGSGGREHALVWKFSQEKSLEILCAPGNGGISLNAKCFDARTIHDILELALKERVDLTVVGPEAYLAEGLVDEFEAKGLKVFGPNRKAAKIESSKVFAKCLMEKYGVPTARFRVFDDAVQAERHIETCEFPIVIKADGLAQGKGTYIAWNQHEALRAIDSLMRKRIFGEAGKMIVIEEFLSGREVSLMVLSDGEDFVPLLSAMDYKRAHDHDRGPNTGGMGAVAPAPHYSEEIFEMVRKNILEKLSLAFQKEGIIYKGILYIGLMITNQGPKVLEFNARFGDPETQVVLPLMKTNLSEVCFAVVEGKLSKLKLNWLDEKCVCVVLASAGYPGDYEVGFTIEGLELVEALVFHAGTKLVDGRFITNGGRVLNVCAMAKTYTEARERVYREVQKIHFKGVHYRKDVALNMN
ncbi:phosphoribosylamine--glycine ligase [Pseudothermotoga sp.]|uniref:phosphoribosylamine--glycine ligase n=1 Tax=Pseudothermotoga sp. TaxID=2033661 RepID=UPI0031F6572B